MDFTSNIKEVLEQELMRRDPLLTPDEIQELLDEEHQDENPRESIFGYPTHPLYKEIGSLLNSWLENRSCPILDLPNYELLDEKGYSETRTTMIKQVWSLIEGAVSLWGLWGEGERNYRVREILKLLGKRGLLDLLGIRKTVGSSDYWPAPRQVLMDTFCAKHSAKAELTVGARALAKHCIRDESDCWWGASKGSESDKNEYAFKVVNRILDNAHWINIHQLPGDFPILEVRQDQGYGARWTHDGKFFRGFLEPQMVDGHEVGWHH